MNIVDRIFIVFAFAMLIIFSFGTKYNPLELFTLEELFIVLCLYVIVWQLLAMICDEILKRLNRPRRTKQKAVNSKPPKQKETSFKPELRKDITRFEPVVKAKQKDPDMSAFFDRLDKQPAEHKDKKPDFGAMYRLLDELEESNVKNTEGDKK